MVLIQLLFILYTTMTLRIDKNIIYVSVRDLVSQQPKQSITLSAFPMPKRGWLGIQAQKKAQETLGLFHREYFISGEHQIGEYTIKIQGKIDGVYETKNRFEIEEIKSVLLPAKEFATVTADLFPEYQEQVLFYSYILQKEQKGVEVVPYLRIINLINDKIRTFKVPYIPVEIEMLLNKRCRSILDTIKEAEALQMTRYNQLQSCSFQLAEHRSQQQEMMQQVETSLKHKRHLLVSAPTGTGKTAGALFPAIRYALQNQKKIFFVTAKTTQQNIVSDTLKPVTDCSLDIHILFLRRSQDMCCNDIFFCHGDYCPYAKEYFDRLATSNIIDILLEQKVIHPDRIFELARHHMLCPAEVMKDLIPYVDLIIGDFNYVFDPAVYLRRLFLRRDYSDWILIIDEAHNLHERGMNYYSPSLNRQELYTLTAGIDKSKRNRKVYRQLLSALIEVDQNLQKYQTEGELYHSQQACFDVDIDPGIWQSLFEQYETAYIKYCIYKLSKKKITRDDPFESYYYRLRHFTQVSHMAGDAYTPYFSAEYKGSLKIQCTDAATPLGQRISGFHSAIGMSATLDPISYYKRVLGFPDENTGSLLVDSPFPSANRKLIIIPDISTRFKDRHANYIRYAEIIEQIIKFRNGNYIIYCPSFEFMQNLYLFLGKIEIPKILQRTHMDINAREEIINRLKDQTEPKLLLAVLGGIFAEGIDLRGDMCIGVIIFSPGLPKVGFERELIARYFEQKEGDGFAYAYLYPGINKVIQAAGRLIRSAQDKGIIVLVDDRFEDREVIELLPSYWFKEPASVAITADYREAIKAFWERFK
jgi:DNA excision repair protein ERCC-2